jgi:glutamine amidotransferase PdxT
MESKQLTYQNWLKDEFELSTVYAIIDPGGENTIPKIYPSNIQPEEISKINKKQAAIFKTRIKEYSSQ